MQAAWLPHLSVTKNVRVMMERGLEQSPLSATSSSIWVVVVLQSSIPTCVCDFSSVSMRKYSFVAISPSVPRVTTRYTNLSCDILYDSGEDGGKDLR